MPMQDHNKQNDTATTHRKSLSRRFLFRLLIILLLGQCVTLGWSLYSNNNIQENDVKEKLTLCGKQLAAIAVASRDSFDFTYLGQLADELIKDSDICRVSYIDNGVPIIDVKSQTALPDLLKTEIPVLIGAEKVGSISIYYSLHRVRKNVVSQALISASLTGALFLFLAIFTRYFFNRDIGSKIAVINTNLHQVSNGDLTVRTRLTSQDELGSISSALDLVTDRLSSTVNRIKSISRNVSNQTSHLSRTFKTLIEGVTEQQATTGKAIVSVQNVLASQQQIIGATDDLLIISDGSTKALKEILVASEEIVGKMDRLSNNVNTSYSTIAELARSSSEVADMAGRANGSVEAADLAVSGISNSVSRIGTIVNETTKVSEEMSAIIANQGMKSVNDSIESMQKIDKLAGSLSDTIASLGSRSNDIAGILVVIKEVTDQTKLLSLNAQILSGQAGPYGRPFAVVASEMKALSNKTANSTKEIETIVSAIQSEMSSVVSSALATSKVVAEGKSVAGKVKESLQLISEASTRSTRMVGTIQEVATEQDQDLQGIVAAFEDIRILINEVSRASGVEIDGINDLQHDFDTIRSATAVTKAASESQVKSIQLISENFNMANLKTYEIATASKNQSKVSEEMIVSMEMVGDISNETAHGVMDVATRIGDISEAVTSMHHEIEMFKTEEGDDIKTETDIAI